MKSRDAIFFLTLVIMGSACKKDKESELKDNGVADILSEFQLNRSKAEALESDQFQSRFDTLSGKFENPGFRSGSPPATGASPANCNTRESEAGISTIANGKDLQILIKYSNSEACADELKAAAKSIAAEKGYASISIAKTFKRQITLVCKNDVTGATASTNLEIENLIGRCGVLFESSYSTSSNESIIFLDTQDGKEEADSEYELASIVSDPKGHPCPVTEEGSSDEIYCSRGFWYKNSDKITTTSQYLYITPKDLKISDKKGRWYDSGSWEVIFNNWEGKAAITANTLPASFSMSDGKVDNSGSFSISLKLLPSENEEAR